jgi:hypothetical protein
VGFTCRVCGEHHAEELRDIRMGLPDAIFALAEAERGTRARLDEDFAVLDDEWFFVRGLLEIPIPDAGERFAYGTWVEVPVRTFKELNQRWNHPQQFEPATGFVANELAPYEQTIGLKVTLQPVSPTRLPLVQLADGDHQLVRDQRHGITVERGHELAVVVLHR